MARRIKSGLKRRRQDEVRRVRNRAVRTRIRHSIREFREAVESGDKETVKRLLPETVSAIDVSVRKGVLQRNTADRYKSRLTAHANSVLLADNG